MVTVLLALSAALGLAAGSFCNVLIHRLPRGESIVSPPSHCPRCGAPIPWYCNLPVVSWVFLLGRCASCKGRISVRYPLVELAVGGLFFASAWTWGLTVATAAAWVFCLWIAALALIDLEHQILPDRLTYPGMVLGGAFCAFVPWSDWRSSLIGGAAGTAILAFLAWVWPHLTGVEGLGWGDVKLIAMIGLFLGWKGALLSLVLASFSGILVGVVYILASRKGFRDTPLPLGTFLGAAALVSLFFQRAIWAWYFGLVLPGYPAAPGG